MPRLIVTEGAMSGMRRCRQFLADRSRDAAERAGRTIARQLLLLETSPAMGRPVDTEHDVRELVISFGDSGYVALYRHEVSEDVVYVLALRHQREAGY